MSELIAVWINNAKTFHQRIAARFLRRHGWVVFYLPEDQRECKKDCCWLKLYGSELAQAV